MKPSGKIDLVSLIASISEILLEKDNFDEAVNTVLQMLGEWFQVDRVYLFTNRQESDNICIDYSFEWCAEGIEAFLGAPELTGVTWDSMPDVYLEMANGNVMFGNVADHPSDSFRELMTMQSIKSYHFFPIIVKSNFFGFVGFDNCKEERDWNLVESQALKSLGNLIAHRFLRDKEYNELQVKKRKEDKITYLLGSFQDLNESLSTNRISNRNHLRILEIAVSLAECDLGFYANKISTSKNEFKVTETLLNTPRLNEKDSRNITINTKDISLLNSKTIRVNHQNGVILIPDLAMEMVLISNDGKAKDFVVSNMVGIPLNHNSSDGDYIVLLNAGHLACSFDLELINRFKTLSEGFLNAFQVNLQKIIAEEELKKSEYLFRLLSENSNDLICLHDANGKFEYISPSMKDILGYDQSEFLGRLPIDLAHPDSIPEMVKQFNLFKDDSVVIPMITNRFLTKQGKAIYLQSSFRKILGHQSQPYKYISTSRDVTHDVILQESLRRSEQHFRLISENASDIVALHSYNLEFIWVSPSIEKLMGYKPEDVIGKTPDEVFHTIHYNEIYSYSKGSKGLVEVCHKTKFGNEIWLEISLTEFIDVDLNFEGLLALSRDVTERKRYQLKLESQRAAFERLFEESLGGYWDYFPQTNEEYLSPGFKRILGYEDHELENKPESWQKLIYSEDFEKLNQSLDNHIKSLGKLSFVEEARYKHKLGHELVVLCAGQVIEWILI
jgi:PAS domain S-box-containing protein